MINWSFHYNVENGFIFRIDFVYFLCIYESVTVAPLSFSATILSLQCNYLSLTRSPTPFPFWLTILFFSQKTLSSTPPRWWSPFDSNLLIYPPHFAPSLLLLTLKCLFALTHGPLYIFYFEFPVLTLRNCYFIFSVFRLLI